MSPVGWSSTFVEIGLCVEGVSARFTAAGNTFMATDPSGDVRSNIIAFPGYGSADIVAVKARARLR